MSQPSTVELPELVDFIAGERRAPAVALEGWICDPNTGARLQQQRATSDEGVSEAAAHAAAMHASSRWADTSLEERAQALDALAGVLEGKAEHLARLDSQTTGVVVSLTRNLNKVTAMAVRLAGEQLRMGWMKEVHDGPHGDVEHVRKPLGPAGIISPWNAPTPITAHKVASALAAGCPVVIKPSEWSPHSSDVLAESAEEAGLPAGLVQVVHGAAHVGGQLVRDERIRAVSFTGGLLAGRAVAEACARQLKPAQLELGGNNALVVLEDADLDRAADGVVTGLTTLNAQWCRALGRLLVHESLHDELLKRVGERLKEVRLGHSLDDDSQMGPMVHRGHKAMIDSAVQGLSGVGGTLHRWTAVPEGDGFFVPPTLVTGVDPQHAIDEIFGPVATVHTFKTDDEALKLANAVPYGLGGYVFSADEERAWAVGRRMETGGVKINGVTMMSLNPHAVRPAWKQSGLGHEGSRETIEFFSGDTVVGVAGR